MDNDPRMNRTTNHDLQTPTRNDRIRIYQEEGVQDVSTRTDSTDNDQGMNIELAQDQEEASTHVGSVTKCLTPGEE